MEMDWPEQKRSKIKYAAARIINALKKFWITNGRNNGAVSAAAIVMAGEALGRSHVLLLVDDVN